MVKFSDFAEAKKGLRDGRDVIKRKGHITPEKAKELARQLPATQVLVVASGMSYSRKWGKDLPWAILRVDLDGVCVNLYRRTDMLLERGSVHEFFVEYSPAKYRRTNSLGTKKFGDEFVLVTPEEREEIEENEKPKDDPRLALKVECKAMDIAKELGCTTEEVRELFSNQEILDHKVDYSSI